MFLVFKYLWVVGHGVVSIDGDVGGGVDVSWFIG